MPSGINGAALLWRIEQVSSFTSTWLPQVQRYRFDLPSFAGTIPTIAMRPPQTGQTIDRTNWLDNGESAVKDGCLLAYQSVEKPPERHVGARGLQEFRRILRVL